MKTEEIYSKMTPDELVSAEKKLKSWKMPTALFIGVLTGIAIWSATHNGSSLTYMLVIAAILIGNVYSKRLKNIQAEISRRNTVQ
ncbi:hypothetical protein F5984_25720 [Rudanella paleaurantiibacter]|uniref:Uncharacterized protein n=1 Tax=Rudanella paleaurantiibacter TaxID=2614655 RepID=A0A7J5TSK9_9BACT|nr:hypothetical protein [Rudanella paleaurantiibacter]KAB7725722.1 hypothetical protein F5984_25720 [Rudanella paleaurantiibacter]